MYLRFVNPSGTYTHALDEAAVAIVVDVDRDDEGLPRAEIHQWSIRGDLYANSQSELITAMRSLEEAYERDGSAIRLLCDDMSTVAHELANTDSGIEVIRRPSYPIGDGAQLSTFRTFEITVRAEKWSQQRAGAIVSYQETLTFEGGGPRKALIEIRNGPPQPQLVSQQTAYYATQSGSAVGYNDYPTMPAPYWAAPIFDQPASSKSYGMPQAKTSGSGRRRYYEFPISWNYKFSSPTPLGGTPTRRI